MLLSISASRWTVHVIARIMTRRWSRLTKDFNRESRGRCWNYSKSFSCYTASRDFFVRRFPSPRLFSRVQNLVSFKSYTWLDRCVIQGPICCSSSIMRSPCPSVHFTASRGKCWIQFSMQCVIYIVPEVWTI